MQKLIEKWKSSRGATMIMALALLAVVSVVSFVVISFSGTTGQTTLRESKFKYTQGKLQVENLSSSYAIDYGGTPDLELVVMDEDGAKVDGYTLTYTVKNEALSAEDFSKLTVGDYTVTVTVYKDEYESFRDTFTLTVNRAGGVEVKLRAAAESGFTYTYDYDGTAHAPDANALPVEKVLAGGVDVTDTATITYTLDGKSDKAAPGVTDAGEYTVTVNVEVDNYTAPDPVTYKIKVNKQTLTITGESGSREYNGAEQTLNGITYEGLAEGQSASKTALTYEAKATNVGDAGTGVFSGKAKVMSGLTDVTANYDIQPLVVGKLSITPIETTVTVTITGKNDTQTYDGQPHSLSFDKPSGYYTVSADHSLYDVSNVSLKAGKSISSISQTEAGTKYLGLTSDMFENTSNNFANVSFQVTDGYVTINPCSEAVTVTITGTSNTVTYDGELHSVSFTYKSSVDSYTEADFTYDDKAFAACKTLSRTNASSEAYTLDESKFANTNANYKDVTFKVKSGLSLTINKRDVTVTGKNGSETYNGKAQTVDLGYNVTAATDTTGLVSGHEFSGLTYKATGTNYSAAGYQGEFNTGYTIKNGSTDVTANYNVITKANGKLTINKRNVTVVGKSGSSTYNGQRQKIDLGYNVTAATATTGLVSGHDFSGLTYEATGTDYRADGYPGEFNTDYTIKNGGTDVTSNYNVITDAAGTLTINKRPITLTSESDEKVYDGTALTKNSVTATYTGDSSKSAFADGESVSYNVTGTITDVKDNKDNNNFFEIKWTKACKESNYDVTTVYGTLKITPYNTKLVVTISPKSGVETTPTYDGETQTLKLSDCSYTVKTADGADVSAEIKAAVLNALQYSEGSYSGALEDYTISGVNCGTYELDDAKISRSEPNNTNVPNVDYVVSDVQLTINKAPKEALNLNVTGCGYSGVYDGEAHGDKAHGGTEATALDGATIEYSTNGEDWGDQPTITNAGTIKVYVRASKANYDTAEATYTLTVTKRPVTITANDKEVVYNGKIQTETLDISKTQATYDESGKLTSETGLLNGHDVDSTLTYKVTTDNKDVGDYTGSFYENGAAIETIHIYAAGTDVTDNYNVTPVKGTLTINPKAVTVKIIAADYTYSPTATKTWSHFVTVSDLCGTDAIEYTSTLKPKGLLQDAITLPKILDAGDYTITVTATENQGNYTVTCDDPVTFTVRKADLTLTVPDDLNYEGVYNGQPQKGNGEPTVKDKNGKTVANALWYSTDEGKTWNSWNSQNPPTRTAAGKTTVWLKAEKTNYTTVEYVSGSDRYQYSIEINKRPIVIRGTDNEDTYDGSAKKLTADGTLTLTGPDKTAVAGNADSGLLSGHKLTVTYGIAKTDAGTYDGEFKENSLSIVDTNNDNAGVTDNYEVKDWVAGTLIISKSQTLVVNADPNHWEEDFNEECVVDPSAFTATGTPKDTPVPLDDVTYTYYTSSSKEGPYTLTGNNGKDVPSLDGKTAGTLYVKVEATHQNYSMATNGAAYCTLTVKEAAPTVKFSADASSSDNKNFVWTYNGELHSPTITVEYGDGQIDENPELEYGSWDEAKQDYTTVNGVPSVIDVTDAPSKYAVKAKQSPGNYSASEDWVPYTLKVDPKEVTLSLEEDGKVYNSRVYDGTTVVDSSYVVADGWVDTEGENITYTVATDEAGIHASKATITPAVKSGKEDAVKLTNYTIKDNGEVSFSITARPITVVGGEETRTYTGSPIVVTHTCTYTNVVVGHTASGYTWTRTETDADTYENIDLDGTLQVLDENENLVTENYEVTKTKGKLTIDPLQITVKINKNNYSNIEIWNLCTDLIHETYTGTLTDAAKEALEAALTIKFSADDSETSYTLKRLKETNKKLGLLDGDSALVEKTFTVTASIVGNRNFRIADDSDGAKNVLVTNSITSVFEQFRSMLTSGVGYTYYRGKIDGFRYGTNSKLDNGNIVTLDDGRTLLRYSKTGGTYYYLDVTNCKDFVTYWKENASNSDKTVTFPQSNALSALITEAYTNGKNTSSGTADDGLTKVYTTIKTTVTLNPASATSYGLSATFAPDDAAERTKAAVYIPSALTTTLTKTSAKNTNRALSLGVVTKQNSGDYSATSTTNTKNLVFYSKKDSTPTWLYSGGSVSGGEVEDKNPWVRVKGGRCEIWNLASKLITVNEVELADLTVTFKDKTTGAEIKSCPASELASNVSSLLGENDVTKEYKVSVTYNEDDLEVDCSAATNVEVIVTNSIAAAHNLYNGASVLNDFSYFAGGTTTNTVTSPAGGEFTTEWWNYYYKYTENGKTYRLNLGSTLYSSFTKSTDVAADTIAETEILKTLIKNAYLASGNEASQDIDANGTTIFSAVRIKVNLTSTTGGYNVTITYKTADDATTGYEETDSGTLYENTGYSKSENKTTESLTRESKGYVFWSSNGSDAIKYEAVTKGTLLTGSSS